MHDLPSQRTLSGLDTSAQEREAPPPIVPLKIDAAGRTDVGLQREHNEDAFAVLDRHGLYLVADGMGGHRAGNVASQMATESVQAFFDSTVREDATWPFHYDPALSPEENRLLTSIKLANKSIYEEGARNADRRGMGTTVVGALVNLATGRVFVGHVGDSRCYRIRDGAITQLTQDHSLINEYLRAMPDLPQSQRDELPRNVITRALGMTEVVLVDLLSDTLRPGDILVLCSDGLSGMLSDAEILATVLAHPGDSAAACDALIRGANEHGGEDNVTALVVRARDGDAPSIEPQRRAPGTEDTRPVLTPEALRPTESPPAPLSFDDVTLDMPREAVVPKELLAGDTHAEATSSPDAHPSLDEGAEDTVEAPSPFAPKPA